MLLLLVEINATVLVKVENNKHFSLRVGFESMVTFNSNFKIRRFHNYLQIKPIPIESKASLLIIEEVENDSK